MKSHTPGRLALALLAAGVLCLCLAPIASAGRARVGGNSTNAKLCQKGGYANLYDASTGLPFSRHACVSYGAHGGTYSSLTLSTQVNPSINVWGGVSGFGLLPGPSVALYVGDDSEITLNVNPDGTLPLEVGLLACGAGASDVYAVALTSDGAEITTPAVNSPCG